MSVLKLWFLFHSLSGRIIPCLQHVVTTEALLGVSASWNQLRQGIFKDGNCLLFGHFIDKNMSIDINLFQDQVMILSSHHHSGALNENVHLDMRWTGMSYFFRIPFLDFHMFMEDSMQSVDCIVLLSGLIHTLLKTRTESVSVL